MEENDISWKRMVFKGNKVWMATDIKGKPLVKNGKVLIKYQLNQDYEYLVYKENVESMDKWESNKSKSKNKKKAGEKNNISANNETVDYDVNNTILIFTDGASSGNPGPSGIGVHMRYKKFEKEISKYIGIATNNIAELEAIRAGLLELKKTDIPVRVFTDSGYAYGLLVLGWRARKNKNLVESIRKILTKFKDIKFIKVKGHAGNKWNERADFLAISAIKSEVL